MKDFSRYKNERNEEIESSRAQSCLLVFQLWGEDYIEKLWAKKGKTLIWNNVLHLVVAVHDPDELALVLLTLDGIDQLAARTVDCSAIWDL